MSEVRSDSPSEGDSGKPKRSLGFYAEAVSITILSMVAASMWIELTKGTICRIFDNNPLVLLMAAVGATLIAIFGLKYMFCEHTPEYMTREAMIIH